MNIQYGRKRSGIKKQLEEKIEDWLSSIDNLDIQMLARDNVIVTGGSIASMLLGEAVNDYDVYFRTREAALSVAKYYVDKFSYGEEIEVREECILDEERISIYIRSSGVAEDEEQGDDDIEKPKYRPVFLSQNAITLSDKIQIIIRFYGDPEDIHNNYDFVHATCYWDHAKRALVLPAEALEALLSRTLLYRGSLYPIASIFRMKKFIERGWRITAGQQLKIMWQISELDLKDKDVLREQLTGVDMAYMYELIGALEEVDPEKINSAYVGTIIDRIFE